MKGETRLMMGGRRGRGKGERGRRGARELLDGRAEELRGEGRGLEEGGDVCGRPERAGRRRLPVDDARLYAGMEVSESAYMQVKRD